MSYQEILAEEIQRISRLPTDAEREQEARRATAAIRDRAESTSFVNSSLFVQQYPKLAPEAMYGLMGDFVRIVEPHSEADPVKLLAEGLVYFGNVIDSSPHIPAEADRHSGNLYVVSVGKSSRSRKGVARGRVESIFGLVDSDWVLSRVQSGLSSGEGVIHAVRDPVERGGEITDEGILDKRLLVIEGEFASTLRVLGRDGNTLSPVLRNAWDGRPLRTLTKHSPSKATGAHVSISGDITQDELLRYLTETEAANGFGNRFLWLCVRRSKCLPEGGNLRESELDEIVERLRQANSFSRSVGELRRDEEAREVWAEVYPELTRDRPGLLGAIVARAEAQVTRLSLIYALLDCSKVVRRCHLEAALALWDYAEASACYIFGDRLGDPVADQILRGLRGAGSGGLTRTQINNHLGRNRKAWEIGQALGRLLDQGLATVERVPSQGGRPREVWSTKETNLTKEGGSDG